MKYLIIICAVVLAIYIFVSLISGIDFSGMKFSEIKFIIAVCLGVAVSVVSVRVGINIIYSALEGLIVGVLFYAFGQILIELLKASCAS